MRGQKKRLSAALSRTNQNSTTAAFCIMYQAYPCSFARAHGELYLFRCRAAIKILHEYFSSHRESGAYFMFARCCCAPGSLHTRSGRAKLFEFLYHTLACRNCRSTKVKEKEKSIFPAYRDWSHCYAPSTPRYALSANLIYNNFHNSTGLASSFLHPAGHSPQHQCNDSFGEKVILLHPLGPHHCLEYKIRATLTTGDVEKSADGLAERTRPAEMEIESEWPRPALGTFALVK